MLTDFSWFFFLPCAAYQYIFSWRLYFFTFLPVSSYLLAINNACVHIACEKIKSKESSYNRRVCCTAVQAHSHKMSEISPWKRYLNVCSKSCVKIDGIKASINNAQSVLSHNFVNNRIKSDSKSKSLLPVHKMSKCAAKKTRGDINLIESCSTKKYVIKV